MATPFITSTRNDSFVACACFNPRGITYVWDVLGSLPHSYRHSPHLSFWTDELGSLRTFRRARLASVFQRVRRASA
eukprot:6193826-Pleurochrysis_carterae.AAC.1